MPEASWNFYNVQKVPCILACSMKKVLLVSTRVRRNIFDLIETVDAALLSYTLFPSELAEFYMFYGKLALYWGKQLENIPADLTEVHFLLCEE